MRRGRRRHCTGPAAERGEPEEKQSEMFHVGIGDFKLAPPV
jgi:hypothetical protein